MRTLLKVRSSGVNGEQRRVYEREYYLRNLEKMRAKSRINVRRWKEKYPERNRAAQARAYQKRYTNFECRARHLAREKEYRRRLKMEVIAAYGGKCACCGETAFEFLSIDHIDGRLVHERRGRTRYQFDGIHLYRRLKSEGWPKDRYRLLCMNCNFAVGKYGYCPHERPRT